MKRQLLVVIKAKQWNARATGPAAPRCWYQNFSKYQNAVTGELVRLHDWIIYDVDWRLLPMALIVMAAAVP